MTKRDRNSEANLIIEIVKRIPLAPAKITCKQIIDALNNAGIELGLRSAQRYLKKISKSDEFGVVCEKRDICYAYKRERKNNDLGAIQLKPNESLLLRLAQEHLRYQMPGDVLKSLDFLFKKAGEVLNENGKTQKERRWLKKIAVVSASIPQMAPNILPRIFDAVSESLYNEVKLDIDYINTQGKRAHGRVTPLGLVQQDVRLYLVCQFENYTNLIHLALHRIKKAEATEFPISRPKDFDLQEYINQRHFNYSNGQWIHWIIEFSSDLTATNLKETPFNRSQKLEKLPNGIWRLEVDIQESLLLDGWIATWKDIAGISRNEKLPISVD